jgi:hypothetical protein
MKKKFKYQKPDFYNIQEGLLAEANCANGSIASSDYSCNTGPNVALTECRNGIGSNDYCSMGTVPGYICSATGSAVGLACSTGGTP